MTYNCFISIGLHSVCYQNDCKLKGKPLWMLNSEMISSLWYWLILALHQSRAFSLHRYKDLLANFLKCWFCLNLCFNSVRIILIIFSWCQMITNGLEYMQNQECLLILFQTSGSWYSCPYWKASIALKVTFFEKQLLKHSIISFLFHSLFWKWYWAHIKAWFRNLNDILQGLNRSSSYTGFLSGALGILMFPSFSFSSLLPFTIG